jgi:3-hydroxyisobutyrate dehydrogenase-like beta-hydroxyacid dehydrogenase
VSERVAFLGLGVMGYPMAGHLAAAGHSVRVYNRTAAKAEQWRAEHGGESARSPAEAVRGARFAFACVGADDDVRAVALGPDGALAGLEAGAVFVDHTTTSARLARDLHAEARALGIGFLDAPVSGGEIGARQGRLSVMVGGEPETFERALPLLRTYSREARRLGEAGTGQLAKMVNQICIAGLLEALAEGLHFAERAGLDARAVVEVIRQGAAGSWQMENRSASMLDGEFGFGFAVDWMRKDLAYTLEEARRNGAQLPVTSLVDQLYAEVQQRLGGGRWDTSSLLARLRS